MKHLIICAALLTLGACTRPPQLSAGGEPTKAAAYKPKVQTAPVAIAHLDGGCTVYRIYDTPYGEDAGGYEVVWTTVCPGADRQRTSWKKIESVKPVITKTVAEETVTR